MVLSPSGSTSWAMLSASVVAMSTLQGTTTKLMVSCLWMYFLMSALIWCQGVTKEEHISGHPRAQLVIPEHHPVFTLLSFGLAYTLPLECLTTCPHWALCWCPAYPPELITGISSFPKAPWFPWSDETPSFLDRSSLGCFWADSRRKRHALTPGKHFCHALGNSTHLLSEAGWEVWNWSLNSGRGMT